MISGPRTIVLNGRNIITVAVTAVGNYLPIYNNPRRIELDGGEIQLMISDVQFNGEEN